MAKQSPLRSAQPGAVSACGKLLKAGHSIPVRKSAIGPRERKAQARGKIAIRKSNKDGFVQVVCTL